MYYFQMRKQKLHLLPKNSDQLSNLNLGCVFLLLIFTDIVLLKYDFNCCNSFALYWVDKVTT